MYINQLLLGVSRPEVGHKRFSSQSGHSIDQDKSSTVTLSVDCLGQHSTVIEDQSTDIQLSFLGSLMYIFAHMLLS